MQARGFGSTDVGKVRTTNQDRFAVAEDVGLFVVSDGMGGGSGGDIAARTAVEVVVREVTQALEDSPTQGRRTTADLETLLFDAFQRANVAVRREAKRRNIKGDMGCTLTALLAAGPHLVFAHVGDSRAYLLRRGRLQLLTEDHTVAHELYRFGDMTLAASRRSLYSNVLTRAVGIDPSVRVDVFSLAARTGDRVLLCSDGLGKYLPDDAAWLTRVLREQDPGDIPATLIQHANEAGGADNITAVVIDLASEADRVEREEPAAMVRTAPRSVHTTLARALTALWM